MVKIIIDPGHGGKDPGAIGNGTKEKDLTLMISQYQQKRFKELNIDVEMTRTSDVTLDNSTRTSKVRNAKANICISNHINAAGNVQANGTEVIHSIYSDGKLANMIMDELVNAGAKKRRVFCRQGKNGDYYFMHRQTGQVETVIIEYEFITNKQGIERFMKDWQKYAESVIRAVCAYLRVDYFKEEVVKVADNKNIPSFWAKEVWDWAKKNNITDGKCPKDNATREEMVTMLYRYDKLKK